MNLFIIFCSQYLLYVLAAAAILYWATLSRRAKRRLALYATLTGTVAFILAKIGSALYYNPRPFMVDHVTSLFAHNPGNGFPSDHTLAAATLAFALFAVSKKWGIVFFLLALAVGSARVSAGVHHPIDVIGGIVFAAAGYSAACVFAPKLHSLITRRRHKIREPKTQS